MGYMGKACFLEASTQRAGYPRRPSYMVGAGSAQQAKGGEARTEKAPLPVDGCGGDVLAEVHVGILLPHQAHEVPSLASLA